MSLQSDNNSMNKNFLIESINIHFYIGEIVNLTIINLVSLY